MTGRVTGRKAGASFLREARAGVSLTEEGRSEAAERRIETHPGREDPIWYPHPAEERGRGLSRLRNGDKGRRIQEMETVKQWSDNSRRVVTDDHGLQR